jgi:hypothetical protein
MTIPTEKMKCTFCGKGIYRDIVDPKRDANALINEGFAGFGRPDGRGWRVLECTMCGHIQLFRLSKEESTRRGWKG